MALRRLSAEHEQAVTPQPPWPHDATSPAEPRPDTQQPTSVVEASPLNLQTNPLFREFIEYG